MNIIRYFILESRVLINAVLIFSFVEPLINAQTINSKNIAEIQMIEAFNKPENVRLSNIIENASFVPLDTSINVGVIVNYEVTDKYIIVRQMTSDRISQILLFDKGTGKLIREVAKNGRGPNEFMYFNLIPYNENQQEVYAQGLPREILIFDLNGKIKGKVNTMKPMDLNSNGSFIDLSGKLISFSSRLNDAVFAGYVRNHSGNEDKKIVLISEKGIHTVFPNFLKWTHGIKLIFGFEESNFYRCNNNLYFFENFCDTLYQVTERYLIPRYYFDWGKYKIPYSRQGELVTSKSLFYSSFFILQIFESKKQLFLKILHSGKMYLAILEKINNKVIFCDKGSLNNASFNDDIYNGLLNLIPSGITDQNEMIFVIDPSKWIRWVADNPVEARNIMSLHPNLINVNEFSNPIIVIAQCK